MALILKSKKYFFVNFLLEMQENSDAGKATYGDHVDKSLSSLKFFSIRFLTKYVIHSINLPDIHEYSGDWCNDENALIETIGQEHEIEYRNEHLICSQEVK